MVKNFENAGFKPEVRTLSSFQDDYGLKLDEEDPNEEDDEDEEDGDDDFQEEQDEEVQDDDGQDGDGAAAAA